jgi:peptide/nickel transport system substrate-binding protein
MRQVLAVRRGRRLPSWKQWRHLSRVLSPGERGLLRGAFAAFLLSAAALVAGYVVTHRAEVPAVGGEYTEALVGEPQLINPLYAPLNDADADLTRLVYSGLLAYDPEKGFHPDLAESLAISEDGKTYTLKIRDDASFHNGDPVRARDVIFTVNAIQNPAYRSPLASAFRDATVSQVDDKTVAFALVEPRASFPASLTVGILPSDVWSQIPARNAQLAKRNLEPIGSGPYQFKEYAKDGKGVILSYTLERFDGAAGGSALIERLTFKFYGDADAARQALEQRHVEGMGFVPFESVADVAGMRGVALHRAWQLRESVLYFNQDKAEILKNKAVRTAIAGAIDKAKIAKETLHDLVRPIDAPVLPGQTGEHPDVAKIAFDLEAAKKALDEAKFPWKDGEPFRRASEKEVKEGEEPTFLSLILTTVDDPEFSDVADAIAAQVAAAGIKVTVDKVPQDALFSSVIPSREYEMLLAGSVLGPEPDLKPLWHSSAAKAPGLNFAGYANRNADALIEAAAAAVTPDERAKKLRELQDLIAADLPAVFLYQSSYAYAVSDKVRNVSFERVSVPSDRFADVREWYIKTRKTIR